MAGLYDSVCVQALHLDLRFSDGPIENQHHPDAQRVSCLLLVSAGLLQLDALKLD